MTSKPEGAHKKQTKRQPRTHALSPFPPLSPRYREDPGNEVDKASESEREGRTGEVVAKRTEENEVRTQTTEGQYSPVRLEQAMLVSSL